MSPGGKRLVLILAFGLGVPLLGVGLYGLVAGVEVETQSGDLERVFSVADLDYGEPLIEPEMDRLVRTRYIDGSQDLEYEFSSDELYVWSIVSFERSDKDARHVFVGQTAGGALSAAFDDGVELVDRNDLFRWGDQSNAKVFMQDGAEVGYLLNARKGSVVYGVIISGVSYEPGDLQTVVAAALDRSYAVR